MKKIITILLIIFTMGLFVSCSKNDDNNESSNNISLTQNEIAGIWVITSISGTSSWDWIAKDKTLEFKTDGTFASDNYIEDSYKIENGSIHTYYKTSGESILVYTATSKGNNQYTIKVQGTLDESDKSVIISISKQETDVAVTGDCSIIGPFSATVYCINKISNSDSYWISYKKTNDTVWSSVRSTNLSSDGSYSITLKNLEPETTYIYKAHVDYCGSSYNGDEKTFTTGKVETSGFVDLGLPSGTKWAACNLGATTPTSPGNSYAWGKINNSEAGYNYTTSEIDGTYYDVAYVTDPSSKMPTYTQINELLTLCTTSYVLSNGKGGCYVTGKNGKTIFIPEGSYWTATPLSRQYAYYFYISVSHLIDPIYKNSQLHIRPVASK